MSIIEGIGDEVIHFFIAFFILLVVGVAWWTTNTRRDNWQIRTVYLINRRLRRRSQRSLTNHVQSATIVESTLPVITTSRELNESQNDSEGRGDENSENSGRLSPKPPGENLNEENATASSSTEEENLAREENEESTCMGDCEGNRNRNQSEAVGRNEESQNCNDGVNQTENNRSENLGVEEENSTTRASSTESSSSDYSLSNFEQQDILQTMDANALELRQRRIHFYEGRNSSTEDRFEEKQTTASSKQTTASSKQTTASSNQTTASSNQTTASSNQTTASGNQSTASSKQTTSTSQAPNKKSPEKDKQSTADKKSKTEKTESLPSSSENTENRQEPNPPQNDSSIRIKLKYINDNLRLVDGRLEELLGDFKRRHFNEELSSNKLVRLIFNGQVLHRDSDTLQSCGFFDNCVVHCLIHQQRPSNDNSQNRNGEQGNNGLNARSFLNNNNNNNREWDLSNVLIAMVSFSLGTAWYFRYQYPHLFTVTATVALVAITGIFTVVSVGMYFPDPEPIQPQVESIN